MIPRTVTPEAALPSGWTVALRGSCGGGGEGGARESG